MCGIAGFWSTESTGDMESIAAGMASAIRHRGPDAEGVWTEPGCGLALAHRRLAVVDLSAAGRQPMHSRCSRYVISYNGEIYNHAELRQDLEREGWPSNGWSGHCDTETLLAAISAWGFEKALERLNGMFAFALWDRKKRKLLLARDRMGEKPLYYGTQGSTLLFGSELKALTAHPSWIGRINRDGLALYMRFGYLPNPHCIYKGLRTLPPGHYVEITGPADANTTPKPFWSLEAAFEAGQSDSFHGSDQDAVDSLEAVLAGAVKHRMVADVPLGAFLSGGWDSSTIVSLMQAQSSRPVKTFTIGFDEAGYDEARHARRVADHLGTEHTELYLSELQLRDTIEQLPQIWDEPFADASQIPTFLVSRLARDKVTVSLSGDGGDELFCGYNRYAGGFDAWQRIRSLPGPGKSLLRASLRLAPDRRLDQMLSVLPEKWRPPALADHIAKLRSVIGCESAELYYQALVSLTDDPAGIVLGAKEPATLPTCAERWPAAHDVREQMMHIDAKTYLPDDILTKVDRASMAVSLESRAPLLDHRVVEFASTLPMNFKLRDGKSKWLLRQVLYRHVPPELVDRPKSGFTLPLARWLRGPLRDWGESLVAKQRVREEGFLDADVVASVWQGYQSGAQEQQGLVWAILMFQSWLAAQSPTATSNGS